MKKYLNLLAFAMLAVFSFTLISCNKEDDSENQGTGNSCSSGTNVASTSELVGTWDIVSTTIYHDYSGKEELKGTGEYWDIKSDKLTIHDEEDMMNGQSLKYTYDKNSKILNVEGYISYTVTELTKTTLVLRSQKMMESYSEITFKKR